MAFVPLPNGVKVAMEYSLNSQLVVNVFHVTAVDPDDITNLVAIAECFIAFWTEIAPMFHTNISLQRVVLTDVSVAGGRQIIRVAGLPIAGEDNTSAQLPNNVAFVTSLQTGFSGRSYRGRTYWAGLPIGALTAPNTLASTYVTNFLTAFANLVDCLFADSNVLVVASYQNAGAPRTTAVATPIISFGMNQVADSQRRRLPGRGS